MGRVKRIWYLSPMRTEKVQASLRILAVSPEPPLLAHTSRESRGTYRQKPRSLAPRNGWACTVKICHDGMLKDTNSLDGAQMIYWLTNSLEIVFHILIKFYSVASKGLWELLQMVSADIIIALSGCMKTYNCGLLKKKKKRIWIIMWATSWENLFMPYANNKGKYQPVLCTVWSAPYLFTA